jgi:hypothetical protein
VLPSGVCGGPARLARPCVSGMRRGAHGLAALLRMNDESKTFGVNDRRKFTAEGERRGGAVSADADQQPIAPSASEARSSEADPGFPEGPVDLSSFVLSQAVHAKVLLTDPPEHMSRDKALAGARYFVSVLEMLESRTEAHRTDGESALLEGVLFDLRMAVVERTREPGR